MITSAFAAPISVPFDSDSWEFTADSEYSLEDFTDTKGVTYPAIKMVKALGFVKDADFTHGTIEFDVLFSLEASSSKRDEQGLVWRAQDQQNYELMHFRDYEFGTPYGLHYMPVNDSAHPLQFYYGPGHNPTSIEKPLGEWIHVKAVVSGTEGEIFVGDMENPALFINDMKQGVNTGTVGIFGGYNIPEAVRIPTYAANFSYESMDTPPTLVRGDAVQEVAYVNDPNMVTEWMVSDVFSAKELDDRLALTANDQQARTWDKLSTDNIGVAFFSKIRLLDRANRINDTAFARVTIQSNSAQTKKLMFGFSDSAKVYLNGQLLFSGDDAFRSRDYRFIGTVGFFDNLYLPLKAGNNELWFAVSDTLAGWGVRAKFADMEGITVIATDEPNSFDTTTEDDLRQNTCLTSYNAGVLTIPCISFPVVNNTGETEVNIYSIDLIQDDPAFLFGVDLDSIVPR
ncbi:hypothetical protein [Candidatus Albibeggiatoa sp. nov. BB20]|uniref:hypothetical protein n=1 Tax=Candidatus Albibeggiatoa sp. nov. BB20 TaxID=3162723 RepID=UPI0033653122